MKKDITVLVFVIQYGSRHIMDSLSNAGHSFNVIFVCGGLGNNPLYLQTHSDVTGTRISQLNCIQWNLIRTPLDNKDTCIISVTLSPKYCFI